MQGIPLIISAPSGTGKTTLCKMIVQNLSNVIVSISHTTRKPRGQEIQGTDYYFTSKEDFKKMAERNEFLEWAEVHDAYYGTSKQKVFENLERGYDVIFDIDIQGGLQIKHQMPKTVLIFLLPPSMEVLKQRLIGRGENTKEIISLRLKASLQEILGAHFYDYFVINDDLQQTFSHIQNILFAERIKLNKPNEILLRLMHERFEV